MPYAERRFTHFVTLGHGDEAKLISRLQLSEAVKSKAFVALRRGGQDSDTKNFFQTSGEEMRPLSRCVTLYVRDPMVAPGKFSQHCDAAWM